MSRSLELIRVALVALLVRLFLKQRVRSQSCLSIFASVFRTGGYQRRLDSNLTDMRTEVIHNASAVNDRTCRICWYMISCFFGVLGDWRSVAWCNQGMLHISFPQKPLRASKVQGVWDEEWKSLLESFLSRRTLYAIYNMYRAFLSLPSFSAFFAVGYDDGFHSSGCCVSITNIFFLMRPFSLNLNTLSKWKYLFSCAFGAM